MKKIFLIICISTLMLMTSCGNSNDDVIRKEEKKTVESNGKENSSEKESSILSEKINDNKESTEKEEVDYMGLLKETVNEICEKNTNTNELYFKLDNTGEKPQLFVMISGNIDLYTYKENEYVCAEKNLEYDGLQGYYYAQQFIDIIEHLEDENIPNSVWSCGYSNYVSNWNHAGDYTYSLAFLNEDNVPEVVCFGKTNKNIRILSWYRGIVVENDLGEKGTLYCSDEGMFCKKIFSREYYNYTFYTLEKGMVECEHTAQMEIIGEEVNYKWDDMSVSKVEYENEFVECYDESKTQAVSSNMEYAEFRDNLDYLFQDYEISDWKRSYIEYIIVELSGQTDDYSYNLMDTDGDSIPELFAMGEYSAAGNIISVYYDGEVYENILSSGGLYFIQNENKYHISFGKMDHYYDKIFHIEKGKCVDDFVGEYGLEDYDNITDEQGNLLPYIYKWNDALVSEEGYNTLFRKEFDSFNALNVTGIYDVERILSILTSEY